MKVMEKLIHNNLYAALLGLILAPLAYISMDLFVHGVYFIVVNLTGDTIDPVRKRNVFTAFPAVYGVAAIFYPFYYRFTRKH